MFKRKKKQDSNNEYNFKFLLKKTSDFIDSNTADHQKACEDCDSSRADAHHDNLKYFHQIQAILSQGKKGSVKDHLTIHVSSMYLKQIKDALVDGSGMEKECYCTGIVDSESNVATPTVILPLDLKKQSAVFAEAEVSSVYQTLISLDNWGHSLILFCHSHPGRGSNSTRPSQTDHGTHKDLETCYSTVGTIFSQDGYVRFFSHEKEFDVEIYGKGVKKVEDKVYYITG